MQYLQFLTTFLLSSFPFTSPSLFTLPYLIGGTTAPTSLSVIDIDSSQKYLAIGGTSMDLTLARSYSYNAIIEVFDLTTGLNLCISSITYTTSTLDVTAIKFSSSATYLVVAFQTPIAMFMLMDKYGGTTQRFQNQNQNYQFYPDSVYIDDNQNLIVAGQDLATTKAFVFSISLGGNVTTNGILSPITAGSSFQNVFGLIVNSAATTFYAGFNFANTFVFTASTMSFTMLWTQKYSVTSSTQIMARMHLLEESDAPPNSYLASCSHNPTAGGKLEFLQIKVSSLGLYLSSISLSYTPFLLFPLICSSVVQPSLNTILTIIQKLSSIYFGRLVISTNKFYLTLLETFSTSSTTLKYSHIIDTTKFYFVGLTSSVQLVSPTIANLPQQMGFIMSSAFFSNCATLTSFEDQGTTLSAGGTLSSTSIPFIPLTLPFNNTFYLQVIHTTSMYQVCPGLVVLSSPPNSVQTFLDTQLPATFPVTPFTASDNSAITHAFYPSWAIPICATLTLSPLSVTLSQQCALGSPTIVYAFSIRGDTQSGLYVYQFISLTIKYTPKNITATPQSSPTYYFTELPLNISLSPFTFTNPVVGVFVIYSISGLPSCSSFDNTTLMITLSSACASPISASFSVNLTGQMNSTAAESNSTIFTVTLKGLQIQPSSLSNYSFLDSELPQIIHFDPFSTIPVLFGTDIIYSVSGNGCLLINSLLREIIVTEDCAVTDSESFLIYVTGTDISSGVSNLTLFNLTISCDPIEPIASYIPNQVYYIYTPAMAVTFAPFAQTYYCKQYTFTYTAQFSDGTPLHSFISFTPNLRQFIILSNTKKDIGSYQIQVFGTMSDTNSSMTSLTFTLTLNDNPPYFSEALQYIELLYNSSLTYKLPPIINQNNTDALKVSVALGISSRFVNFSSGVFKMAPQIQNVGSWMIKVVIQDQVIVERVNYYFLFIRVYSIDWEKNFNSGAQATQNSAQEQFVGIEINKSSTSNSENQIKFSFLKDLQTKITRISSNGTVEVHFSVPMIQLKANSLVNKKNLKLVVLQFSESENRAIYNSNLNWTCSSYQDQLMVLQVAFEYSFNISRVPVNTFFQFQVSDKLFITFLNESLFKAQLGVSIPENYSLNSSIPTQLPNDSKILSLFFRIHRSLAEIELIPWNLAQYNSNYQFNPQPCSVRLFRLLLLIGLPP